MFDIKFYQKAADIKKRLAEGERIDKRYLFDELERYRSVKPIIYNIETTNACNMRCVMCPRTTMMTRPVETLDMDIFKKIVDEIGPFSEDEWRKWEEFCAAYYGIAKDDMSENHFFLYVIPRVLVLHGYGDPLLDIKMPDRVDMLTKKGIPSYFSCNPANIDIDRTARIFEKGLAYIKFSIESIDNVTHKKIRGSASDFTGSYRKIKELLTIKNKNNYKTTIVITMLDLSGSAQEEEFRKLKDHFDGLGVYIYLKSQDQKWYSDKIQKRTRSLHWIEFCQFPWSSMTIKSNGEAAMCVEDFNNEIILGDVRRKSLHEIWNGPEYAEFRKTHFGLDKKIKCTTHCDMTLIGNMCQKDTK